MATNPAIIMGFRPGEVDNPLDLKQKALTIGSIMGQQRMQAAQTTGLTQENAIRAKQMQDREDLEDAVKQAWEKGNSVNTAATSQVTPPATIGSSSAAMAGAPSARSSSLPSAPSAPLPHNPDGLSAAPGLPPFGTPGIDDNLVTNILMQKGKPDLARQYMAGVTDMRTKALTAEKDGLDNAEKKVQMAASLLSSVKDPQTMAWAVSRGRQNGLIDPARADWLMTQGYSTDAIQWMDQQQQAAVKIQDHIANLRADNTRNMELSKFHMEVVEKQPKLVTDWLGIGSRYVPDDPEYVSAWLGSMKEQGAPQAVIDQFSQAYASGGAAAAKALGMTAAEQQREQRLGAHEQVLEDQGQARIDIARDRAATSRGTMTASKTQDLINQAEKSQEAYQTREQALWGSQDNLKRIAKIADKQQYIDPKYPAQPTTMTPERRTEIQGRIAANDRDIGTLQRQQKEIRQKMKWGEFGPKGDEAPAGQQGSLETPADPPAAAAPPPLPKGFVPPAGKIRVQLGDKVGWIIPGEFDAKTMKKL